MLIKFINKYLILYRYLKIITKYVKIYKLFKFINRETSDDELTQEIVLKIILIILIVIIYIVPSVIACEGCHPSKKKIILLNLGLGWTIIGWIFSVLWAFKINPENPTVKSGMQK